MDRNIISGLGVILIKFFIQRLNIVIQTCPCHTRDRHDADCILIAHLYRLLRAEGRLFKRDRHKAHLHIPELTELLPYHLKGGTHNQIRLIAALALLLSFCLPAQQSRHATEHTRLRRAYTQRTSLPLSLLRAIPEVCDDIDTTTAHHRHTRILRLVDIVYIHRLIHQLCGISIHRCCHKCCEVESRLCLRIGFVLYCLIGDFRLCTRLGQLVHRRTIESRIFCFTVHKHKILWIVPEQLHKSRHIFLDSTKIFITLYID